MDESFQQALIKQLAYYTYHRRSSAWRSRVGCYTYCRPQSGLKCSEDNGDRDPYSIYLLADSLPTGLTLSPWLDYLCHTS